MIWGRRDDQWSFTDSKGYVNAVQSQNPNSSCGRMTSSKRVASWWVWASIHRNTCIPTVAARFWVPGRRRLIGEPSIER